jgi:hypothetical protein
MLPIGFKAAGSWHPAQGDGHSCYVRNQTFPCETAILELFIGSIEFRPTNLALSRLARLTEDPSPNLEFSRPRSVRFDYAPP